MEVEEEMPSLNVPEENETMSAHQIANDWLDKYQNSLLNNAAFRQYWRHWVPKIYGPTLYETTPTNWKSVDEQANNYFFKPLELLICNGEPDVVLSDQWDRTPAVCGRVFKLGEPTYSCRECGVDMTCVLCVDCFKKSEHRFHKYKMGTSGGGGCCDCGDAEAWKKAPSCDIHKSPVTEDSESKTKSLPEDLKARTSLVFDAVLWYAYNLLTLENASDLRVREQDDLFEEDSYCTILYNDEVHTFEQVISTISRVIKCPQKQAIEYVTNIDREGRAVVKCASFVYCNDLKTDIEKITSRHGNKPLKVLVVHSHEVAHQIFAMKLLSWLQEFLSHGEGFRDIFAEVALKVHPPENSSIIKGILLHDSQLWKSARTHWHRLLISGMLLEYEHKKSLAKMFTKHYGNVMKDFIKDDHDHSFSVSSLSVQLFTVPTLAHHLIANDDALFILLNTFISECSRKCNSHKKLEFDRGAGSAFKRSQYILYDLRYLLSFIPDQWTNKLRLAFLQALSVLLNLLMMMQGMDSATRQVGQHMEYEPEWETAFNLHIKLAYCISLALKWCGTDKKVLVKAYRATLQKLFTELTESPYYDAADPREVRELMNYSILCLHYDVSSKPVSIHLPLSRFLAGLHMHLESFGLQFNSPELVCLRPNPVQIIEPVLRTRVMISQVHAGMWRRNGYALLNQLYFYHNVKCRTEMLDRDVTLLQIGATLIEGNEFLIHLLNKFHLLNWIDGNFETNGGSMKTNEEDSMRQTVSLVEELLQLLIVVIGERYIPGISDCNVEDRIKKEIIQHLCIKPLPHSELNKTIPDDLTHETGLDDIIDELAVFKKPSQSDGKGVYELKPEFYNDYNVCYYHYSREDLSKSEETQRNRRKAAGELDCAPPPKLPKLTPSFVMLVNLLQCDVMLHIMHTVLSRCLNLKALSFSELQLHKTLHLIGYALQEEESKYYPFLEFSEKATRWKIPTMLVELSKSPRVETHKPLLHWTIKKFQEVMKTDGESNPEPTAQSSLAPDMVKDDENKKKMAEKERRAKLAAERRAQIMAQMKAMQNSFIKENAQMFAEGTSPDTSLREEKMDTEEVQDVFPVCLGPNQTSRINIEKHYVCILCQEEQKVTIDGSPMVLAAFVHQSTVLCQNRNVDFTKLDPLFLNANLGPAPHTSTCGHVMHSTCWQRYFDNVMTKEHRRPYRLRHPASFDVDKQEFLCPLCECISNTVLPLVPSLWTLQPPHAPVDISFDDWLRCLETSTFAKLMNQVASKCTKSCTNIHCTCENASSSGTELEAPIGCSSNCGPQASSSQEVFDLGNESAVFRFVSLFSSKHPELSAGLKEMIENYTQATYTRGLKLNPHPEDRRLACMAWKSCSYTIHSIETILRDSNKPLLGQLSSRHRDCLESLVRIMGVLGATWPIVLVINSNALKLLAMLFNRSDEGYSILRWDTFGVLVPLTFSLPSLFCKDKPTPLPSGGVLEQYTLRLLFISHIVKILITNNFALDENCDTEMITEEPKDKILLDILELLNKKSDKLNCNTIWTRVKEACIPFLRCCTLFYHYLTDVPAPSVLTELGGDTFDNMCSYLDLPKTPSDLIGTDRRIIDLIKVWCSHDEVKRYLNGTLEQEFMPPVEPLSINRLITLPNDYSELINTVSSFTCPNSDREDSRNPTMCLVCSEVLCSQSYCCQTEIDKIIIGACNYHAHTCGAGVGIFLRVRECEILYLATPHRGCFVSPPYLDEYGETDQGLRRGNALHLCQERYKKLQSQWLNHSILEVIARYIETSSNLMPPQWQHL